MYMADPCRGTRYDRICQHQISIDRNNEVVSLGKYWRYISIDTYIAPTCRDTKYDYIKIEKY